VSAVAVAKQKRIERTGYLMSKGETLDPAEVERRTTCQCGDDSRPFQEEVDREFVRGRKEPVVRYETRCLMCGRSVR
jgi:hypothetical protein